MKKIILVLFIIGMISTPCLAEVRPNSLFSIEGTLWSAWENSGYVGFYNGEIYVRDPGDPETEYSIVSRWDDYVTHFYYDLLLFSVGLIAVESFTTVGYFSSWLGVGVLFVSRDGKFPEGPIPIFKINDDWTPPYE